MRCEQASEMMSARLDGCIDRAEIALLEEHMAGCVACRDEWLRLQMLDSLLASAPMVEAPGPCGSDGSSPAHADGRAPGPSSAVRR